MILRRFMKHVSEQNWFAVGLDVIVVVTGIFLGLQVDDWRQEQEMKKEEALMIFSLREDVVDLIEVTEKVHTSLERDNNTIASAIYFLQDYKGQGDLTDDQCIAVWQSHITGVYLLRPLSALESIIASGRLNIISNPLLRDKLVALRSESERHQKFHDYISSTAASLIDNFAKALSGYLTPVKGRTSWDEGLSASCHVPQIAENPTLMNKLRTNLGRRTGLAGSISGLLKSLRLIKGDLLMETENQ